MKIRTTIQVPRHTTFDAFDEVVEKLRERGYPQPAKDSKSITWTLDFAGSEAHTAMFEFKEALDEVQPVLDACGYDHLSLDNPDAWETVA